eukprot:4574825-Prymnesium_polylepis.1
MHVVSVAGSAEHGPTPDSGWDRVRGSEAGDAVSIRFGEGRVRPGAQRPLAPRLHTMRYLAFRCYGKLHLHLDKGGYGDFEKCKPCQIG